MPPTLAPKTPKPPRLAALCFDCGKNSFHVCNRSGHVHLTCTTCGSTYYFGAAVWPNSDEPMTTMMQRTAGPPKSRAERRRAFPRWKEPAGKHVHDFPGTER